MKHIIKILFFSLFFFISCSKEEINEILKNQAEMEGQTSSIEELCKNMNRDIVTLKLIINSPESGNHIIGFKELADGSGYTISFSKSGTIIIKNGKKGENGKDGHNGHNGTNGKDGINGTNGNNSQDGTNGTDGKDGEQGNKGQNGSTPIVTVKKNTDGNLYWAIKNADGTSSFLLDNKKQKVRASGTNGIVPVIGVNAAGNWILNYESGPVELKDPAGNPIKAKGAYGDPMFKDVVSEEDYIVFHLSDGTTFKVAKVEPAKVELETSKVAYFQRGETRTFTFICYGLNKDIIPVSTAPNGWIVTAKYKSATDGEITVTAPQKGSSSGALSGTTIIELTTMDNQKVSITLDLTLLFEFKVPDSSRSFVYEFYFEGIKVGELCNEFIPGYSFDSGKNASVFYPYNVYNNLFEEGLVLDNGGKIDYLTAIYIAGANTTPATSFFTENGESFIIGDYIGYQGNGTNGLYPYQTTDNEGNSYRVMKIGTQYWMADNLRTITNNKGIISSEWKIDNTPRYAVYGSSVGITEDNKTTRNQYGLLYNAGVFLNINTLLTIKGWKIPNHLEDWDKLRDFLGGDSKVAQALKIAGFAENIGGRRKADLPYNFEEKDEVGYWWLNTKDNSDCWVLSVNPSNVAVMQSTNIYNRGFGFSIRFIRE